MQAERTVTLPFSTLSLLTGPVNTTGYNERSPIVSADGLTLYYYFSTGIGNGGLYVATRAQPNLPFSAGQPALAPLNTTVGDSLSWISADSLTAFLTSTRGGTQRIYVATREHRRRFSSAHHRGDAEHHWPRRRHDHHGRPAHRLFWIEPNRHPEKLRHLDSDALEHG